MLLVKGFNTVAKHFFSKDLEIQLLFFPGGGIDGFIQPFLTISTYRKSLTGLFVEEPELIRVSFFSEHRDECFLTQDDSCFSGFVTQYTDKAECLFLKRQSHCTMKGLESVSIVEDHLVLFD